MCGKYEDAVVLSRCAGGLSALRGLCRKGGETCNLDHGALYALRHICLVEDKKIFAFKISVGSLEKLAAVAEQYALTHLDKPLKSYDF